jgi:hypothetical protein
MEQSTLMLMEILGLVGVACLLTVALFRGKAVFAAPEEAETTSDVPTMLTTIFCPERRANAGVAFGVVGSGSHKHLDILTCDLLPDGEACERACIDA